MIFYQYRHVSLQQIMIPRENSPYKNNAYRKLEPSTMRLENPTLLHPFSSSVDMNFIGRKHYLLHQNMIWKLISKLVLSAKNSFTIYGLFPYDSLSRNVGFLSKLVNALKSAMLRQSQYILLGYALQNKVGVFTIVYLDCLKQ